MCPLKYYQLMRNSKDKKQWRYVMVQKAKKGVKAAAQRRQMIVLNEHALEKPHAMVVSASAANGVFLKQSPAR